MDPGNATNRLEEALQPSPEKTNFMKLTRLLICGGTRALKDLFDFIIPPRDLASKLSDPSVFSTLEGLRRKRILTQDQWVVLFPSSRSVAVVSESFDITLLFKLLREICGLTPPATGWDNLPHDTDTSLEADLARIKYYRNRIYAHVNNGMEVSDDDFQTYWNDIKDALVRIFQSTNSTSVAGFKTVIDNCLAAPLSDNQEKDLKELRLWCLEETISRNTARVEEFDQRIRELQTSFERINNLTYPEITVKVDVVKLCIGAWVLGSAYVLHRYKDDPDTFLRMVKEFVLPTGALVLSLRKGSVKLQIRVETLTGLEEFWERYKKGQLKADLEKVLITEELKKQADGDVVELDVHVSEEEYKKARERLKDHNKEMSDSKWQQGSDEDTNLNFEEKVKRLQDQFKAIPPLMIKKVLQRDDVKGDLRTALECLKTMSNKGSPNIGLQGKTNRASESSNGKKQNPPIVPKKPQKIRKEYEGNYNSGKCENESESLMRERSDIEEATGADNQSESRRHENLSGLVKDELFFEDTENDDGENLSLEEKVKIPQQRFKGFPPFAIRKILQRQDVKEDLEKAYECLESISPLKGTFKEGEGDKEKASKEQKPRRKAWGQEKEKAKGNQGENPSGITDEERSEHGEEGAVGGRGGAEDNAAKTNPQKKKRNNRARNRKNKIQVQGKGGNERNNENMERPGPPKSWQGGFHHQQWEHGGYMQQPQWQGEYPQQPWGQGGYSQQPRGRSGFNPGGPPQGRGRHFRGGNQRGYPRGDYERGHPRNYYHGASNVGPHQWDGYDRGQIADYPYYEGFPPAGGFKRAQSDVDIRMNRGQPRPRRNSTEKENPNANANANAQNRQSRGGHRWAGRGAGRGAEQRQTAEPQNVQSQIEIQNLEPNMIVIRGLKTSTTSDAIRNFVEAISGEEVLEIVKMDQGNALVTLQKLSAEYFGGFIWSFCLVLLIKMFYIDVVCFVFPV